MEALAEPHEELLSETAELIRRAKTGDPAAMPEIRKLMEQRTDICQILGDVAANALVSWIRRFAGDDLIQAEAVGMQMDQLRDELTEPSDGPLEKLLVEQMLVTYIQLNYSSAVLAQSDCTLLATLRYLDTRLEKTTRRLTHLAKTLELLRRARSKTKTSPQRTAGKQSTVPLEPEPAFPDFAPSNRIRELVMGMA
jgi:hypothetical protein